MTTEEKEKIYNFIDKNILPNVRHYYVGDAMITQKGEFMRELEYFLNSLSQEKIDKFNAVAEYLRKEEELSNFAEECGFSEWCAHAIYVLRHHDPDIIKGTYTRYKIDKDYITIFTFDEESSTTNEIVLPIEVYYDGNVEEYAIEHYGIQKEKIEHERN